ncbi:MAG: RNA methyltransferase [Acidimicrobiales bacterium]|nr:RNA methyltransferase [Hyphomonadaceae bacterium]RZV43694.1 MAG: RNA methyltransferase [Acidimicrobiales bacterium]
MGKSLKNQLGEVVEKTENTGPAPVVVLVGTQLGENIGGAARAMLNFGLTELRLVKPRDGWPSEPAVAMAAGASEVLDNAKLFETTAEAVADLNFIMAATARRREIEIPVIGTAAAGTQFRQWQSENQKTGILFGPEKAGLVNEDVVLADYILTYPINPAFQSLNLAQAVGVFSYIWASAETTAPPNVFQDDIASPATRDDLVRMFEHFETELQNAGFFYPPEKMQLMKQNIRAPFIRARMTEQEVRTMRGMIKALVKGRGRHLSK